MSRNVAYQHRKRFARFRAKWDEALVISTEALEAEARSRAFDRDDPGSVRLLTLLLQAHKPEKYAPKAVEPKAVTDATAANEPAVVFYIPDNGRASNAKPDHTPPAGPPGIDPINSG